MLYIKGLNWQLDRVAYTAPSRKPGIKGALRSIFYWLIPFGTRGWRTQPFMTSFFSASISALSASRCFFWPTTCSWEKIGFSFVSLNQTVADILSWGVVVSAVLLAPTLALPEVRILTTAYDYLILFLSAAPFITGLICRYEVGNYSFWLIAHIICGEILLICHSLYQAVSYCAVFLPPAPSWEWISASNAADEREKVWPGNV